MTRTHGFLAAILLFLPFNAGAQKQEPAGQLEILMESCQFSQAISLAELFLTQDSTRTDLFLLKGRALSALFRYRESVTTLQKALRYDSINIRVLNELVNVYRLSGDPGKAIETCRKITRLEPDNRYFRLQLANLYYLDKDYHEAADVLMPLYKADTADFFVIKQLANCYDELMETDSAEVFYRHALKIIPYDPNVTARLANLLIRRNEVNTAFYITALYLKQDPENIPILKQNAYCNYLLLDFQASALQLRECLRLGDSTKFTKKYLGLSCYKQEKYDTAAPFLRAAFLSDTTDAEVCFYYGVSETRSLGVDTGLVYLQRTLGLLMPSGQFLSTLYAELANAYTLTSHPDTAIMLLRKALEANPNSNIIRFKIAYQYDFYLRKHLDALPWYREFLKYAPPPADPERLMPRQPGGSGYVKVGSSEINLTYVEYAGNRIRAISGAGKKK